MTSVETHGANSYDLAPPGPAPWTNYRRFPADTLESEFQRSHRLIQELRPDHVDPFTRLCNLALSNSLLSQCNRNVVPFPPGEAPTDEQWQRFERVEASPSEILALIHERPEVVVAGTMRLTNVPNDWASIEAADGAFRESVYDKDAHLDTRPFMYQASAYKVKSFSEAGQVISIKGKIATHFGGEILSRRRHLIGIDYSKDGVDQELVEQIVNEQRAEDFNYEKNCPEIGRLVMQYLTLEEKPEWLDTLLVEYYAVHLPRYKEVVEKAPEHLRDTPNAAYRKITSGLYIPSTE